jgi:hypothetical protein
MDCGCKKPNDNHGNADHITWDQLQRAARASNTDPETVADRIHDEARRMRDSGDR